MSAAAVPAVEFRPAYRAALESAAFFDLSARGKVRVQGKDAPTWLQNLCTNDVKSLARGASCEAFFTTPKARTIAHVFIHHLDPEPWGVYLLDMVPDHADKLAKHLNFYIISEEVEVADVTSAIGHLRVIGPRAKEVMDKALATWGRRSCLPFFNVAYGTTVAGSDLLCRAEDVPALSEALRSAGAMTAGPDVLETLRVEAGIPEFGKDIDENRLVMEVGRTEQAISYSKGCFLGQEPIVMARDRGQVNRTLMGVTTTGDLLTPGSKLFQGETEIGQTASCVFSPRLNKVVALAYLRRAAQTPGLELRAFPPTEGRSVVVATLPFVP